MTELQNTAVSAQIDTRTLLPLLIEALANAIAEARQDTERREWKPLHTTEEVAAMFGVKPRVVDDCRRRGEIGCVRLPANRVRFSRENILDFVRTRTVPPGTHAPPVAVEAVAV